MERSPLAVLIPALNEAATIHSVVTRAVQFGDVIVVDDGSVDSTAETARQAGARVIRNTAANGYDHAIEAGFAEADSLGYEFVVTMDADGEHDPEVLAAFRTALIDDGASLVIGQRPRARRFSEALMGWYFRRRFGVRDPLCGMKGYRIELYRENDGFDHINSIGTELAFNALRNGHGFQQVPVSGSTREDTPRIGRTLVANYRIGKALLRLLFLGVKAALGKRASSGDRS